MNKRAVAALLCVGSVLIVGCSKETRNEAIDRTTRAAKELNGTDPESLEKEQERTPDIVARQQRKERRRQNSEWTPENQAKHPVEYCQAQLETVARHMKQLEVQAHQVGTALSQTKRRISEANDLVTSLSDLLKKAMDGYRKAEAEKKWPMMLNGYPITQDKAKKTIVETSHRIKTAKSQLASLKLTLGKLDRKSAEILKEQQKSVALQEKIRFTISDLKLSKLVEGQKEMVDVLGSISDAMDVLGENATEPTLENLMQPTTESVIEDEFSKIMEGK